MSSRLSHESNTARLASARGRRGAAFFVLTLLLIEFLDEVLDGAERAAWPLIRDDLRLSYAQIGVLLSVPSLVGSVVESSLGILADVWRRRALVLGGGFLFACAVLLVGVGHSFAALLVAFVIFNPASGAFVNLSQATLMDAEPHRREQNMARWTLSGSLGNAAGPALVGAAVALGVGWRSVFVGLAVFSLAVLAAAWRLPFPTPHADAEARVGAGFREGVREALRALRRREVLRWLLLLQFGDFTSDMLRGFVALYFVDVVGVSEGRAAMALVVWTLVGLPGDFFLLPLLERVRGLSYLRVSTACTVVLFPAFLLAGGWTTKLVLLGLLGLANTGWYAILKAQLYAQLPGRSGTALTLANVFGLGGSLVPLALGAFAQRYGLGAMMWLLLAGPLLVLAGLMNTSRARTDEDGTGD